MLLIVGEILNQEKNFWRENAIFKALCSWGVRNRNRNIGNCFPSGEILSLYQTI